LWRVYSASNQSLSFSLSQEDKVSASDVATRPMSDADVDGVSERVGEFTVWFNDFTRFDQQLHLLIDLNVFADSDEQLLLLLKVGAILQCSSGMHGDMKISTQLPLQRLPRSAPAIFNPPLTSH